MTICSPAFMGLQHLSATKRQWRCAQMGVSLFRGPSPAVQMVDCRLAFISALNNSIETESCRFSWFSCWLSLEPRKTGKRKTVPAKTSRLTSGAGGCSPTWRKSGVGALRLRLQPLQLWPKACGSAADPRERCAQNM